MWIWPSTFLSQTKTRCRMLHSNKCPSPPGLVGSLQTTKCILTHHQIPKIQPSPLTFPPFFLADQPIALPTAVSLGWGHNTWDRCAVRFCVFFRHIITTELILLLLISHPNIQPVFSRVFSFSAQTESRKSYYYNNGNGSLNSLLMCKCNCHKCHSKGTLFNSLPLELSYSINYKEWSVPCTLFPTRRDLSFISLWAYTDCIIMWPCHK